MNMKLWTSSKYNIIVQRKMEKFNFYAFIFPIITTYNCFCNMFSCCRYICCYEHFNYIFFNCISNYMLLGHSYQQSSILKKLAKVSSKKKNIDFQEAKIMKRHKHCHWHNAFWLFRMVMFNNCTFML